MYFILIVPQWHKEEIINPILCLEKQTLEPGQVIYPANMCQGWDKKWIYKPHKECLNNYNFVACIYCKANQHIIWLVIKTYVT